jgi:translocation and assembly module TamB
VVDASFALHDSRVAGQAVSGQGQLAIAWPRIPRADIELAAGNNRLTAHGAYGQAGDLLKLDLDARNWPLRPDGGVQGHWDGRHATAALPGGTLHAARLGWPARPAEGLALTAALGSEPGAPLHLDLRIAQLDPAEQAGCCAPCASRARKQSGAPPRRPAPT